MALDTKLRDEFIELSHEDLGIEFVALQPVAIVDHVCSVDEATLKSIISGDDIGGSRRVGMDEIQRILGEGSAWLDVTYRGLMVHCICEMGTRNHAAEVSEYTTKAGGSAANTIKGLASGFGVRCQLVRAHIVTCMNLPTVSSTCSMMHIIGTS